MKVLMLSWEYPPHIVGGLGRHVTGLAPALAADGVEVHLVTPLLGGGEHEQSLDGKLYVYRAQAPRMSDYEFIPFVQETNRSLEELARTVRRQAGPFDMIHAHDWLVAQSSIGLKQEWKRPLLSTIHATERGRGRGLIWGQQSHTIHSTEMWLVNESTHIITASKFMAHQVYDYFQIPMEKIDVVPNGVEPLHAQLTGEERSAFRSRYAEPDEQIVFSVGRLVYEKGIHILVEAMPRILAARPKTRFIVAGTGAMREMLERRAYELGLGHHIHFTGFIADEERDKLYQVADVAVFPSIYEPFGIVALEAMTTRCPVVVSQTGGLQEVVRLHETGIIVYPDDPDSLAWGILHTLQHPEWAAARAENAFRIASEHYTWQHVAELTIKIYRRMVKEWRKSLAEGKKRPARD